MIFFTFSWKIFWNKNVPTFLDTKSLLCCSSSNKKKIIKKTIMQPLFFNRKISSNKEKTLYLTLRYRLFIIWLGPTFVPTTSLFESIPPSDMLIVKISVQLRFWHCMHYYSLGYWLTFLLRVHIWVYWL